MQTEEYNPLDYTNLTRHCVEELLRREASPLPPAKKFSGAGVYALFYSGDFGPYASLKRHPDWPIYVGSSVPSGARTGTKGGPKKTH